MIFQRALRRELLASYGAVFTTLFSITITFMLIRILAQAAGGKVATEDVITLIGFASLDYLPILLVLSGFISTLLVITRAYQDSEMVVWFASGQSLTAWIRPVLMAGLPFLLLTASLSFIVTPWANQKSQEVRSRYEKREDIARVSPGKFQESASSDRIFFVEEVAGDLSKVQNVFINTIKDGRSSVIVAKEGRISIDERGDRFLVMNQGRRYDGMPTDANFQMMQFENYAVLVTAQSKAAEGRKNAKALAVQELLADPNPANLGELLWRIALPSMGLVLMLMAVPLGFVNPRVGRSANLIIALILAVLYLSLIKIIETNVVQQKWSFAMAWWPLHGIALALAALMFSWRLQVNSAYHPSVWMCKIKCVLFNSWRKPA